MHKLRQIHDMLTIHTAGRGLLDMTARIAQWLEMQASQDGLCTIFVQHTSASLVIQENADSRVLRDLEYFFARLIPDGYPLFTHNAEGPDDMPAHVRAALTQTQLSIPVRSARMALGTWQAVYLYEHRRAPHRRQLLLCYIGT